MDAVMKGLSLAIGAYNALLWRTAAGTAIGAAAYLPRRGSWPTRPVLRIHLVRGVVTTAMAMLFFWGLARVPMAQAIALAFVAPLIALYLAAIVLKERIERRAIVASLLGLAGVLVILSGQARADLGTEALHGSIAILCSAVLYAYNIVLMRQQALVAKPLEISFFMNIIMFGCFLLAAPLLAVWPEAAHWPAIAGAAGLAYVSMMLLAWAYARAEAQHLAPVEYTGFVWAALLGLVVFGEPVGLLTIAGAAMIVGACIHAARRRPPLAADAAA
ncbi:MAG: DMT family transporter [Allosphingosinicella sp.]|uniref:DMT family transporter n=1 Tax=Allosphingosinicella sp. TaxID=2823234 RepID=UPI003947CF1A